MKYGNVTRHTPSQYSRDFVAGLSGAVLGFISGGIGYVVPAAILGSELSHIAHGTTPYARYGSGSGIIGSNPKEVGSAPERPVGSAPEKKPVVGGTGMIIAPDGDWRHRRIYSKVK